MPTALEVEPAPIERREGQDFFGNRMTWIELDQPHDMLTRAGGGAGRGRAGRLPGALDATPPWEAIRDTAFASLDLAPMSPAHYLFPSRQVSLDPEIRAYAAESFPPDGRCSTARSS